MITAMLAKRLRERAGARVRLCRVTRLDALRAAWTRKLSTSNQATRVVFYARCHKRPFAFSIVPSEVPKTLKRRARDGGNGGIRGGRVHRRGCLGGGVGGYRNE